MLYELVVVVMVVVCGMCMRWCGRVFYELAVVVVVVVMWCGMVCV